MRIVSVSRRTDVPAFYSDWFMNRVRDGSVRWANPFSNRVYCTSLRPEDVAAFVFWSKNYLPLVSHLDELDGLGYPMVFHFTINDLPRALEPNIPDADRLIECAGDLFGRYGADAVLWRYDPIIVSTLTDRQYHLRKFAHLCAQLQGATKRCYFSFPTFYRKVKRNLSALHRNTGIVCEDLSMEDRVELASALADIATEHGIEMLSCCGDYLVGGKIGKGHCVDAELLQRLYPGRIHSLRKAPTRGDCGCCECTDIGAYDTCAHGCVYCYANGKREAVLRNCRLHDADCDMLQGVSDKLAEN